MWRLGGGHVVIKPRPWVTSQSVALSKKGRVTSQSAALGKERLGNEQIGSSGTMAVLTQGCGKTEEKNSLTS